MNITITLNGHKIETDIQPEMRLIDWLRAEMTLTATKEGCGEGECGACTVLLDGGPVNSCLILMGQVNHKKVTTLEGVRDDSAGNRLITSFSEKGAVQCGFCTPGMIMASLPLIMENKTLSADEVKQALSGNLCRCTGYSKIVEAVLNAFTENKS